MRENVLNDFGQSSEKTRNNASAKPGQEEKEHQTMRFLATTLALALTLNLVPRAEAAEKDIVDTAVSAGSFKTLVAAVQAADLVGALKGEGPFTVFAPTDDAFAKLPKGTVETLLKPENKKKLVSILTYHAVAGEVPAASVVKLNGAKTLNGQQVDITVADGKVKLDDATVVATDIKCSNGIIHVIDSVILPADATLAETAVKAGSFSTLVAAVKAADLLPALTGKTELTVFAPTDEAFAKLPAGTVENLLKPKNKTKLAEVLKYHVVAGRVYSSDALAAKSAETLQGQRVSITVGSDGARVNDAKLLKTDIDASNGVIHVIDSVLLPSEKTVNHSPRRMIETAISQGAPLYNAGRHSACAKVYMSTVESLMQMEDLPSHAKHQMQVALTSARNTVCSNTQAWTLRHALDNAYRMASRN